MSIFDQLPVASMVTLPVGYQARQRHEVPSATVAELDTLVEEAGGQVVRVPMQSKALRPGRTTAPVHEASYYLIPDDAFDD